jgi:hypothetical protein
MGANDNITDVEQRTIDEARNLLGDNLADFLLSGLGETDITHRRAFTAQSIPLHGEAVTYQLEIINDSKQGLPIAREPLVLALLINMLRERQPMDDRVTFSVSDIMEKLQWSDITESQLRIKQAVEKYVSTAYCLVDPTVSEEERSSSLYASFKRILIDYETTSKLLPVKRTVPQRFIKVQFKLAFINSFISQRKSFLGLEFQKFQKIVRAAPP